jgi:hypothetical protein
MPFNNAMQTDSATAFRFQIEDHWRGAADCERWARTQDLRRMCQGIH